MYQFSHTQRLSVYNYGKEYWGGAVFWSPRKLREAKARDTVKQREEEEEKLRKSDDKKLKEAASLYKKQQQQATRECEKVRRRRAKRTRK
jgi:hypothetical protein